MKRLLFFIAFMTLANWALIELLTTEPAHEEAPPPPEEEFTNALEMTAVAIQHLEGERLRWQLWADRAVYDEQRRVATLDGVQFRVYDPAAAPPQRETLFGRARRAVVRDAGGRVVLEHDVHLVRGSALEIRSERIEYDEREQVLLAPRGARVRTPRGVHEGDALRYSLRDDTITFEGPRFYR